MAQPFCSKAQDAGFSPADSRNDDELWRTAQLAREMLDELRVADRVVRALRATGYESLQNVVVAVHGQVVHLQGRIPNQYLKQVAQATALGVVRSHQVRSELEVGEKI